MILSIIQEKCAIYGSLIPIANSNKQAQTKTNPFPSKPTIKRIGRLDITKEIIAIKVPMIDKMLKIIIIK